MSVAMYDKYNNDSQNKLNVFKAPSRPKFYCKRTNDHFVSQRDFLTVSGFEIPVPHSLRTGTCTLCHSLQAN